jgi:hypothetical protein
MQRCGHFEVTLWLRRESKPVGGALHREDLEPREPSGFTTAAKKEKNDLDSLCPTGGERMKTKSYELMNQ